MLCLSGFELYSRWVPLQINAYSTVLQFVLPRFISSKKFRSYLTLDGKTNAA